MTGLADEIRKFITERQAFEQRSRQMAAFRLATGIDLSAALAAEGEERARIVAKLGRIIERERLRGSERHWSYDVNRHIALKQALDELCGRPRRPAGTMAATHKRRKRRPVAPPPASPAGEQA
jgi:hypothetical protein